MGKIMLDPQTVAVLGQATGDAELCGPDGRPVGYYLSPDVYRSMQKNLYEWTNVQVTDEELERAFAGTKRYATADILKLVEGD